MSGDLAADLQALLAAQTRLEGLIERAARQRRTQRPKTGRPDDPWLEPLPYLFERRWSADVGPRPRS